MLLNSGFLVLSVVKIILGGNLGSYVHFSTNVMEHRIYMPPLSIAKYKFG